MRKSLIAGVIISVAMLAGCSVMAQEGCQIEESALDMSPSGLIRVTGVLNAHCFSFRNAIGLKFYEGAGEGRKFIGATDAPVSGRTFQALFMVRGRTLKADDIHFEVISPF